jgi:para-nitrobenzyl esterase
MPRSLDQTIFSRRQALLLAATTSVGATGESLAFASDSIKTGSHQESGNCSTPRSAVAKTQYGKVRGFLADGIFTFKGVPYGQTTAGENR